MNNTPLVQAFGKYLKYKPRPNIKSKYLAVSDTLCGVEIELENFRGDANVLYGVWDEHQEGSLVNGREFVMHPPRNGADVDAALDLFFDQKFRYTGGERTSVHIHVDVMDGTTIAQLRSMTALTYLIEGAIYRIADENRKWGGYSCPLTDMHPKRLDNVFNSKTVAHFTAGCTGNHHEDKYYGFNLVSVTKHGTVEFRYFPCTDDKATLVQWLNLCLEIKKAGVQFDDPQKVVDQFQTQDSAVAFIRKYLPASADAILMYLNLPDTVDRSKLLDVTIKEQEKEAPRNRNGGVNPLALRFINKRRMERGLDRLPGPEYAAVNPMPPPAKRIKNVKKAYNLYDADGQVDINAYNEMLNNIRKRMDNLNAEFNNQ